MPDDTTPPRPVAPSRSACLVEALEPRRLASAAHPIRIGVLGDSYSDEYRFYPPDRSHAANWVQQLAANGRASFGAFTTKSRGAPRNQGYADDWALSAATSADLPAQTTGLAAQAAAGKIDVATVLIGGDDFLDLLESAALDPTTDASTTAALPATAASVVANIETAVDAILAASPTVRVVVATLPPVSELPLVASAEASETALGLTGPAALVAATDAAEVQVNAAIKAFVAADPARLAVADFAAAAAAFAAPTYTLGRFTINATTPGDKPRDLFLADGVHPGTVGQAVLANTFVAAIDTSFGGTIKPLTTRQIAEDARLVS